MIGDSTFPASLPPAGKRWRGTADENGWCGAADEKRSGLGRRTVAALSAVLAVALFLTGGCALLLPAPSTLSECAEMRRGDDGECVQAMQNAFFVLEYDLDVDGTFGTRTENAVRTFQSSRGLTEDGVAGKQTLVALEQSLPDGHVSATNTGVFTCSNLFGTCTFYFNRRATDKIYNALAGPAGNLTFACQVLKERRAAVVCGLLGTLGTHAVREAAGTAVRNDACLAVDLAPIPVDVYSNRGRYCQR